MKRGQPGTEDIVYSMIDSFLQEESFMHRLTNTNIVRMTFVRPIGENLVFSSDDIVMDPDTASTRSSATAAALLSVVLSFACAAALLVGLHNRREASRQNPLQKRWIHFRAQHRGFFHNLDDEKSFPVRMTATEETTESPEDAREQGAVAWSVSDLTSDGESIIGSLRLDPIDEEAGEQDETTCSPKNKSFVSTPSVANGARQFSFVPTWEIQRNAPHAVSQPHGEKDGACPTIFSKADISWLEGSTDEEAVNPNESQEVSEGTLVGCAFLADDDLLRGGATMDTASVATTPTGNVQPEQDSLTVSVGEDDEEEMSKYHSPSSFAEIGSTISTNESEQATEYLSPTQSNASHLQRSSLDSPSSTKEESTKDEVDIFLISWARDALSKIKNGEAFQGDKK